MEARSVRILGNQAHSGASLTREGGSPPGRSSVKAAIEEVPLGQENMGFYSTYFLVPKKDGGFMPILNLKGLNRMIEVHSFKMVTLRSVIASVQAGNWLMSIDLKDAYLHVPIHTSFRRYLWFSFDGIISFGCSRSAFQLPREFSPN